MHAHTIHIHAVIFNEVVASACALAGVAHDPELLSKASKLLFSSSKSASGFSSISFPFAYNLNKLDIYWALATCSQPNLVTSLKTA